MRKTYSELLRDPRWQRKRLEVLQREDFTCEDCGAKDKTLNVHHDKYRPGAAPWEYDASELRCLCEDCHAKEHALLEAFKARWKDAIDGLGQSDLYQVLGYAEGLLAMTRQGEDNIHVINAEHWQGLSDSASAQDCAALKLGDDHTTSWHDLGMLHDARITFRPPLAMIERQMRWFFSSQLPDDGPAPHTLMPEVWRKLRSKEEA